MSLDLRILGVIVHSILLYSIFDIYYTSPIIGGLPSHNPSKGQPPSKRLFLISADGLRYDTFSENEHLSPFIHSVIREGYAVSGISFSHVPTESRPGHIAMVAGFTEDVSAVARGWKENPVQFDTLFNRSDRSFQWGSEDITHLFSNIPRVNTSSFPSHMEDFSSLDNWKLDQWVFDQVEMFIRSPSFSSHINHPRLFFFLHLVGLDTNGHGHKPHSQLYKQNIKVVDDGIRRLTHAVQEVFQDDDTSFIFTSDHGMTDWGSHGGGSNQEIETPFVVWGSGVTKGLSHENISQIDLCPLMSALLGISPPINNHGILPHHLLNSTPQYVLSCTMSNFLQLKEIVDVGIASAANRIWGRWSVNREALGEKALTSLINQVRTLERQGRYLPAISLLSSQIGLVQSSIFYYHRVDRPILGLCVSISFLLFIALLHLHNYHGTLNDLPLIPSRPWIFSMIAVIILSFISGLPICHSIYILLPIYLASFIPSCSLPNLSHLSSLSLRSLFNPLCIIFLVFLINLIFYHRRLTFVLPLLLLFFPSFLHINKSSLYSWIVVWRVVCICLIPFSFFPPSGLLSLPFLSIFPPFILSILLRRLRLFFSSHVIDQLISLSFINSLLILLSYLIHSSLILRVLTWFSLPLPLLVAYRTPPRSFLRLLSLSVALFLPYSLLSSSYESCFLLLLLVLLFVLSRFHSSHSSHLLFLQLPFSSSYHLLPQSILSSSLPLVLVVLSLFSSGNLASLSSFDPSSLSRLVSVFSPFTMAALLLLKLLTPLLLITLHIRCCLPSSSALSSLSIRCLILTDLLAILFFWQLRDNGSWLDIGMSIAHFVISVCTSVALYLFLILSDFLLTSSFQPTHMHFSTA